MNFKDNYYYIAKTKEVLGIVASATMFALFVILMFVLA